MTNRSMTIEQVIRDLDVVTVPHPALRYPAKPLVKVDRSIQQIVERMFELMYAHRGVGLAANQVALPFQIFVVNTAGEPGSGTEHTFINPVIQSPRGRRDAEEGCLSIPSVYAEVARPEAIRIQAYAIDGSPIDDVVKGQLARVIQHEYDHLQGVLFIDRVHEGTRRQLEAELQSFEFDFRARQTAGTIPSDADLQQRLIELEQLYCGR